jgi:heptosyltransferase-2
MEIAILKLGALGDVLRTTSILVRAHPLVAEVRTVEPEDDEELGNLGETLRGRFDRILSLDDELALCRLATAMAGDPTSGRLSGAYVDEQGERRYTPDVAPWFDMGLLSVLGKEEADRLKLANRESHAQIYARMLGIEPGEPRLELEADVVARARAFVAARGVDGSVPLIGLNTGAGGRWESKRLPVDRAADLALELHARRDGRVALLLLGGPGEAERNAAILRAVGDRALLVDAGTDHGLLEFAALVYRCDLLVTSDSLALHVAVARRVPTVAFFAPTSAVEIDLHGRGEKVRSTSPDYGSYRSDADTSTLTVERLADAVERVLAAHAGG